MPISTLKPLILSLILASAAHADQWFVNGRTYNGTLHQLNAARTLVFVTSDWDNYGGSWVKVDALDSATRVRLGIATPQEHIAVQAANERARIEAERRAQEQKEAQAYLDAQRAIKREEEKLALQREALELERRRLAQQQRPVVITNTIVIPSSGYGPYHHRSTSGTSVPHVPHVPSVPSVPPVPAVPAVPSVP